MMNTPNASLKRWSTVPVWKSEGNPALNCCGGSNRTFGNMKRVVATAPAAQAAANAVQATPSVDRNPRRVMSAGAAAGAAGFAAAAGAVAAGRGAAGAGDAGEGAAAGGEADTGPSARVGAGGPGVRFVVSSLKARPCS